MFSINKYKLAVASSLKDWPSNIATICANTSGEVLSQAQQIARVDAVPVDLGQMEKLLGVPGSFFHVTLMYPPDTSFLNHLFTVYVPMPGTVLLGQSYIGLYKFTVQDMSTRFFAANFLKVLQGDTAAYKRLFLDVDAAALSKSEQRNLYKLQQNMKRSKHSGDIDARFYYLPLDPAMFMS